MIRKEKNRLGFRSRMYSRYVTKFKKNQLVVNDKKLHSYWAWVEVKYWPLLSEVKPDSFILEVGCGPGYVIEFLEKEGFKNVQGIDISEEQVQLALKRGLNAQVADVFEFLRLKQDFVDVILGIDFLEHFTKEELMELVPLLYSSLKKGGKIILQVPNGQGLLSGQVVYGDMTHLTIFTPESLEQLLRLHGFSDIRFKETGPVAKNFLGCVRLLAWKCIRIIVTLIKKIETGRSPRIWTENMICYCRK